MRIATLRTLIAVLSLAAILLPHSSTQTNHRSDTSRDHHSDRYGHDSHDPAEVTDTAGDWEGRRLTNRELQMLVRNVSGERGDAVECCPSKLDMVMPVGGTRMDGHYVELFQVVEQSFYEVSCLESVVDKPCRFIDRRLQAQSRCMQKYSYSYALVRDDAGAQQEEPLRHARRSGHAQRPPHNNSAWRMDYIRVRSGCSCEISPKNKKKRATKKGKRKKEDEDSQP